LENENQQLREKRIGIESLLTVNNIRINPPNPGESIIVGISDLEKRNEEAVFDALTAFDKKCPYCLKEQFRVGIRDKIEIDHFIPISKGGQNIPWNLVPICKSCNRKKKDRLPYDFLDNETFHRVNSYLSTVQKRFQDEGVVSYATANTLTRLVDKYKSFITQNSKHDFIKELIHLTCLDKVEYLLENKSISFEIQSNDSIIDKIKGRTGEFQKGIVGSPFHLICERIAAESNSRIEVGALLQYLKRAGWKDCGRVASREYQTKKHIYCAPEFKFISKSELRRKLELSEP